MVIKQALYRKRNDNALPEIVSNNKWLGERKIQSANQKTKATNINKNNINLSINSHRPLISTYKREYKSTECVVQVE